MSDPQNYERTQRLDQSGTAGQPTPPIAYTEDYSDGYAGDGSQIPGQPGIGRTEQDRTYIDPATGGGPPVARPPMDPVEEEASGRTWGTPALVFASIIALLLGVILALLLLPEEDPTSALDAAASQQALADAALQNEELANGVRALQAENEQLRADLDARQAEIDAQNAQVAGDNAAAQQALADQQAAQDARDAALTEREAVLAQREAAQDEREAAAADGDGGVTVPDLGDVEIPDLPEFDEEQARGVVERLIDRLQGLLGG